MTQFTRQDADTIIAFAQNAPLRNLREAETLSETLQRFAKWYDETSKPSKASRVKELPAGQSPDPAT